MAYDGIKLKSTNGRDLTLAPPSTSENRVITLPARNANIITTSDTGTVWETTLTQPFSVIEDNLVYWRDTNNTGNITIDGIPTWANRIVFGFASISTPSSAYPIFRVRVNGTTISTGYDSNSGGTNGQATADREGDGTGFLAYTGSSAYYYSGHITLMRLYPGSNIYVCSGAGTYHPSGLWTMGGFVNLSDSITGINMGFSAATTLDAGVAAAVFYE